MRDSFFWDDVAILAYLKMVRFLGFVQLFFSLVPLFYILPKTKIRDLILDASGTR